MRINSKFFSLPPYISTSWNNVIALRLKDNILSISLADGDIIEIPDLNKELIALIFEAHQTFLENEVASERTPSKASEIKQVNPLPAQENNSLEHPFKIGFATLDHLGSALEHNPSQAESPEIPKEILQKIAAIAKIVAPEDLSHFKVEPHYRHCNCLHCQISRAIENGSQDLKENSPGISNTVEPSVSDEELQFCQWDITQTGEKMYLVANRLEPGEKYSVYLGEPIGCTCGKPGCEHVLAVLKS